MAEVARSSPDRDGTSADPAGPEEVPAAVRSAVRGIRARTSWRTWAARPQPRAEGHHMPGPLVELLAELRRATGIYTRALRAAGVPPERMLPRVKALVREAMSAEQWADPAAAEALTAYVVAWSIDAYFAA